MAAVFPADFRGFYDGVTGAGSNFIPRNCTSATWSPVFAGTEFLVGANRVPSPNAGRRMAIYVSGLALFYQKALPEPQLAGHVVCELMGPYLQATRAVTTEANRNIVIGLANALLYTNHSNGNLRITNADFVAIDGIDEDRPALTWAQSVAFMITLADGVNIRRYSGLTIALHAYIAIVKRGTVSDNFVNKIVLGVQQDINQVVEKL